MAEKKETKLRKYRITVEIDPYELGKAHIVRGIQRQMGPNWKDCSLDSCDCVPAYMAWLSVSKALNLDPGPDLIGQITNLLVMSVADEFKITNETKEQVVEMLKDTAKLDIVFKRIFEAARQTKKDLGSKLPLAIAEHMKLVIVPEVLADLVVDTLARLKEYVETHKQELQVAAAEANRLKQSQEVLADHTEEHRENCTCDTCMCDNSCKHNADKED